MRLLRTSLLLVAIVLVLSARSEAAPKVGIEANASGTIIDGNRVDGVDTGIRIGDGASGQKVVGNTVQSSTIGIQRGGAGGNYIGANKFSTVTTEWSVDGGPDGIVTPTGAWWRRVCVEDETRTVVTCLTPGSIDVNGQVIGIENGNLVVPGVLSGASVVAPLYFTDVGVPLKSIGAIQGNAGQVIVTKTGQKLILKGVPPTTVSTTNPSTGIVDKNCSDTTSIPCVSDGQCPVGETCVSNTLWIKTELDFKSAYELNIGQSSCFPDEEDLCGPRNRPCCNVPDAFAQMQRPNNGNGDNGSITCTGDHSKGCMTCSGDASIGCNEDADCYDQCLTYSASEKRCSQTNSVCVTDADCDAGLDNGTCGADDDVCSGPGFDKGTCAGPRKRYHLAEIDGALYSGQFITAKMSRPGSWALTGVAGATVMGNCLVNDFSSTDCKFPNVVTTPEGPYTPDQALVDLTGSRQVQLANINLTGFAMNQVWAGGVSHEILFSVVGFNSIGDSGHTGNQPKHPWHGYVEGEDNGTWNYTGVTSFTAGTGNGFAWTTKHASCSHDKTRACIGDSNCDGRGLCNSPGNSDYVWYGSNFLQDGGACGVSHLILATACGDHFNQSIDYYQAQGAGAPPWDPPCDSVGLEMRVVNCTGPFNPANPDSGICDGSSCLFHPIRPELAISFSNLRKNDDPTAAALGAAPEFDRSVVLGPHTRLIQRGPFSYNTIRRSIASTAKIVYSDNGETGTLQPNGFNLLGMLPGGYSRPNDPQEGEIWSTYDGHLYRFYNGTIQEQLWGASQSSTTGNWSFAGDLQNMLKSDIGPYIVNNAQRGDANPVLQWGTVSGFIFDLGWYDLGAFATPHAYMSANAIPGDNGGWTKTAGRGGVLMDLDSGSTQGVTIYAYPAAPSATPASTATPTPTPTFTRTITQTVTGTPATYTPTSARTATNTSPPTITGTRGTETRTPTRTGTATSTRTATLTPLPSEQATPVIRCAGALAIASDTPGPGCDHFGFRARRVGDPLKPDDADNLRARQTAIAAVIATMTAIPTPTPPRLLDARDAVAADPVLGDIPYGNASPFWTKLAGNTTTTAKFLSQTGTGSISAAPSWAQVGLTTGVTGVLPIANGGTNQSGTLTAGSILFSNGTTVAQDNSALFFDSTNKRFGMNTTSPAVLGHFKAKDGSSDARFRIESTGTSQYSLNEYVCSTETYHVGCAGSAEGFGNANKLYAYDNTAGKWRYQIDTNGRFSIGNTSSQPARLALLEETIGNEVFRIESTGTDNPKQKWFQARGTAAASSTTNVDFSLTASVPNAPCPSGSVCEVDVTTVCHCTSGSSCTTDQGGVNHTTWAVKNNGGTISQIGSAASGNILGGAGSIDASLTSITMSVSSPNIRIAIVVPANYGHVCRITYKVTT